MSGSILRSARRTWVGLLVFWISGSLDAQPAPLSIPNDSSARRLVERYCVECHSGAEPAGKLALTASEFPSTLQHRGQWQAVYQRVRGGEMPPVDSERPTPEERTALVTWASQTCEAIDLAQPRQPGHVTLRRLNRIEYNLTIRDLIGVDWQPAQDFPSDDVGYGFDNIGDVLSLSPILMEKYLAAAQRIIDQAIQTEPPRVEIPIPPLEKFVRSGVGDRYGATGQALYAAGTLGAEISLPKRGEYTLRIEAFGDQMGDEPVQMEVRLDQQLLQTVAVTATQTAAQEILIPVAAPAGDHHLELRFTNDQWIPAREGKPAQDRNLYVTKVQWLRPPLPEDYSAVHRRIMGTAPRGSNAHEAAKRILRGFATRAFRRPVTEKELAPLLKLYHQAASNQESFESALKIPLTAVLVSPHFLFRVEVPPAGKKPGEIVPLGEYEVASRLSYFLWSSMPDDELMNAAAQKRLSRPEELQRQVERMLRDVKSQALTDNFAGQWLQLRSLEAKTVDPKTFPDFSDRLRQEMQTESRLFFQSVLKEDRAIFDLIDADYTFLNGHLARYYGIAGVQGPEFRRVSTAGTPRGGVLTQASVLTLTSHPTRTSPVKRGKFILENLLGAAPPPPPPGIPDLKDTPEAKEAASIKERLERHRADPNCGVCHQQMDALGFALENFNGIGQWRTQDGAFPVEAAGVLPSGESFRDPTELKQLLRRNRDDFRRCLTEKMLTYALGRGLEETDRRAVREIMQATAAREDHLAGLIVSIVQSDPFLWQTIPGDPHE